jgi:hypothetical protein
MRRTEWHDQVELIRVLKAKFKGYNERVVHEREWGPLDGNVSGIPW